MAKNLCGKLRPENDPYEIWDSGQGWMWKVRKKYQADDDKPFARWYCTVISPYSKTDTGDVYVSDIKSCARRTK